MLKNVNDANKSVQPYTQGGYAINRAKNQFGKYKYTVDHMNQAQGSFWHEFGHHIHQQKGNQNMSDYMGRSGVKRGMWKGRTPMEGKVFDLHQKLTTRKGGVINDSNKNMIFPSTYAKDNFKEWWCENLATYKMGGNIHPEIIKFYKQEGIID